MIVTFKCQRYSWNNSYCTLFCVNCDKEMFPVILAWWIGQGSRKRWWWRRLCEGGGGCLWKARGGGGRAVLQVRSSHARAAPFHTRFSPSFSSMCFHVQAEGEGADGSAEEAPCRGDWAPQEGDRASTEGDRPSQGENQKTETWRLKLRGQLSLLQRGQPPFFICQVNNHQILTGLLLVKAGPMCDFMTPI